MMFRQEVRSLLTGSCGTCTGVTRTCGHAGRYGCLASQDNKEGFSYRAADHKTLFENVGVDVVNHVEMGCAGGRAQNRELAIGASA